MGCLFTLCSVLWCTEVYHFGEIQFIFFSNVVLYFWCHIQEIISKSSVMKILSCVLSNLKVLARMFSSLLPFMLIFIISGKGPDLFFGMWISHFYSTIYWKHCLFSMEWFWHIWWNSVDHMHSRVLAFLFHWSISLSLCQYCPISVILALQLVLKSGSVSFPILLFFMIVLVIWDSWNFPMNFRMAFSIFVKHAVGILIEVEMNF